MPPTAWVRGGDEMRSLCGHAGERMRAQSHGERARRHSNCDLGALEAGAVLSGKGFEGTARIEHGDRQWFEVAFPGSRKHGRETLLADLELQGILHSSVHLAARCARPMRAIAAVASTTVVLVLAVRLEALEIAGHYRLHRVRVNDAEPGQGAPVGLRGRT